MAALSLHSDGFFGCSKVKSRTAEPSESLLKWLSSRLLSLQQHGQVEYPNGEGYRADEANITRNIIVHTAYLCCQSAGSFRKVRLIHMLPTCLIPLTVDIDIQGPAV